MSNARNRDFVSACIERHSVVKIVVLKDKAVILSSVNMKVNSEDSALRNLQSNLSHYAHTVHFEIDYVNNRLNVDRISTIFKLTTRRVNNNNENRIYVFFFSEIFNKELTITFNKNIFRKNSKFLITIFNRHEHLLLANNVETLNIAENVKKSFKDLINEALVKHESCHNKKTLTKQNICMMRVNMIVIENFK